MNKHYCVNCGAGTAYEFEKPKFCGSCGQPFAGTAVAKVIPKRVEPPSIKELVEREETESSSFSDIDKDNFFEITGLERNNVFKGEELIGSSNEKRVPRTGGGGKVNKKQILKAFSERASSKTRTIEVK